jgi:type IV secretory pathway VirB4 component
MNQETRFSGHWIVGAQGTGKTTLLLHMLAADLKRDASIIILDAKGDLSHPVRNLALGDRLIVMDEPFAINPLDVSPTDVRRAINFLEYMMGSLLDANVTPRQRSLVRSVLRAAIAGFPGATLRTVREIINTPASGLSKYAQQIAALPPDLQEFFASEWGDYDSTRIELKWRLRLLLENDLIQRMFGAAETRFHLSQAMDSGAVVVIDNSIEKLHEDGSAFVGRFFLAQIWAAAMACSSRPREAKKPVFVYIDEAQRIIDTKIAQIIDECRSQNIALILAHQRKGQIEDKNVLSALENCAIKMANVDAEASYFSKLLHIPEERMNRLPVGHFATAERGTEPHIINVERKPFPVREMTSDEMAKHRERTRSLYGIKQEPPLQTVQDSHPTHGRRGDPIIPQKTIPAAKADGDTW